MKNSIPEIIEALTPLFLATIGGVIGIVALVQPEVDDTKMTAGLGLAGTAIAGTAGLARTGKNEQDFSIKQQDRNLKPADSS